MPLSERIVVDPAILAGKPVIRGTRLAVEFILDLLAAGQSESDILTNYPGLTREDILACLSYASYLAHEFRAFPIPA
jgi:uncharacterized protein (DUF433 family)